MSFGSTSKLPSQNQRAFGLQSERANTNQQARPVPLIYGQQRVGLTFISDVFDLKAVPVTQTVGKQSQRTGTNYYASFAALIGHGPFDGIYDIFLNGEPVFASATKLYIVALTAAGSTANPTMTATAQTRNPHGLTVGTKITAIILGADQPEYNGEFLFTVVSATQLQYQIIPTGVTVATSSQSGAITLQLRLNPVLRNGAHPDFANITIPDYGLMTIYWGTETQQPDSYLNKKSGLKHPAYLGLGYVVFHQLFFGFNQTNVPNVELVVAKYPSPSWGGVGLKQLRGSAANPAYVITDLLENPRSGLALPKSMIDYQAFDTASIEYTNEKLGIARAISRDEDLRSILTTICETIDSLPVLSDAGLPSLLPVRPPGNEVLPTVGDADFVELPEFNPQDWSTTFTETRVTFLNSEIGFLDDARVWRDSGALSVVRSPDSQTLDRPWIIDSDLAQTIANVSGQAAALPIVEGKFKARYNDELFASLAPGMMFKMAYSLRNTANLVFRVTSRSIPSPSQPEFVVEFQADRTYLYAALIAEAEAPPPDDGGGDPPPVPDPTDVTPDDRLRFVELPPALCPGQPAVAALVARGATAVNSFTVWMDKNYAWEGDAPESYPMMATSMRFAFHGYTRTDYSALTEYIDLKVGVLVQFDGPDLILDPITAFEALNDTVLCFMGDEILSLAGWTLFGEGLYQLMFVRGRFGTPIQAHPAGERVLLISRKDLAVLVQPNFQPGNLARFKVTLDAQDAGNVDPIELTLAGVAWRVPPPAALAVNGRIFDAWFRGGNAPFNVSWIRPDAGGVLPRFDLVKFFTRLRFKVAGDEVYSIDIGWPATSVPFTWHDLRPAGDCDFTIEALSVVKIDWHEIISATTAQLNVRFSP